MNEISGRHLATGKRLFACMAFAASALLTLPAIAKPVHTVITVPVGAKAPAGLSKQIATAKQAGKITNLVWIDSTQAKDAGFASLITLEFPDEASYAKWSKDNAASLAAPVTAKRVEVLTHGENRPRDSSKAVFKVNHYKMKVAIDRYEDFALGYIAPLMEGQRDAGLLTSYVMYGEPGPVGSSEAMLIAEYKDTATFDRTGPIKEKVRADLTARHPEYARFDPIKDTLRDSGTETLGRQGVK